MEWNTSERRIWRTLKTPYKIQTFIDALEYSGDDFTRSVRVALQKKKAHCFDGALTGAAALEQLGFRPQIVDLRAENDDDHVLAVFQVSGCWGAVAKSNFAGLRYREPIYKTIRELALSYFEPYFNLAGERTLREFSKPMSLLRASIDWRFGGEPVDQLGEILDSVPHKKILSRQQVSALTKVDERSFKAGSFGVNVRAAYRP